MAQRKAPVAEDGWDGTGTGDVRVGGCREVTPVVIALCRVDS